jgi:ribosomal protein S18 acetylase RimI-like enzyme
MTHTLIRIASPEDVEDIDHLLRALAESTGESTDYAGNIQALGKYAFSKQPIYRALLAKQKDTCVGLCTFYPEFSSWRCQPGLYVLDLYVDSLTRGEGLGKQLLSEAIRYAREEWQASYMRLSVMKTNQQGRAFYAKLGFQSDEENKLLVLQDTAFDELT